MCFVFYDVIVVLVSLSVVSLLLIVVWIGVLLCSVLMKCVILVVYVCW